MNTFGRMSVLIRIITLTIFASAASGFAHAESPVVRWERIEGIDPNATGQALINGINPVTFPWSTSRGGALLNTENGRIQFHVEGLSMGASPTPFALIGTTGAVTMVKGTVVCHEPGGEIADTDAVDLSPEGDALFSGELPFVPDCEQDKLIFLLRIAAVVPGAPPISNLWLAHGAARKTR